MPITVRYDVPATTAAPVAFQGGYDVAMGAQEQAAEQRRWQIALQQMQAQAAKEQAATSARAAGARSDYAAGEQRAAQDRARQYELEDRPYREQMAEEAAIRRREDLLFETGLRDDAWERQQTAAEKQQAARDEAIRKRELDLIEARKPGWGQTLYEGAKDVAGGLSDIFQAGAKEETKRLGIEAKTKTAQAKAQEELDEKATLPARRAAEVVVSTARDLRGQFDVVLGPDGSQRRVGKYTEDEVREISQAAGDDAFQAYSRFLPSAGAIQQPTRAPGAPAPTAQADPRAARIATLLSEYRTASSERKQEIKVQIDSMRPPQQ